MIAFLMIALLAAPTPGRPVSPSAAKPGALSVNPPPGGIISAGTLTREALKAGLALGPQRFIASVHVTPLMKGRRFLGFQLAQIKPGSPLMGSQNIRVGDVIISVNKMPVERPDQFMKAWESLASVKQLDVKLRRAGQTLVYRWQIGTP